MSDRARDSKRYRRRAAGSRLQAFHDAKLRLSIGELPLASSPTHGERRRDGHCTRLHCNRNLAGLRWLQEATHAASGPQVEYLDLVSCALATQDARLVSTGLPARNFLSGHQDLQARWRVAHHCAQT